MKVKNKQGQQVPNSSMSNASFLSKIDNKNLNKIALSNNYDNNRTDKEHFTSNEEIGIHKNAIGTKSINVKSKLKFPEFKISEKNVDIYNEKLLDQNRRLKRTLKNLYSAANKKRGSGFITKIDQNPNHFNVIFSYNKMNNQNRKLLKFFIEKYKQKFNYDLNSPSIASSFQGYLYQNRLAFLYPYYLFGGHFKNFKNSKNFTNSKNSKITDISKRDELQNSIKLKELSLSKNANSSSDSEKLKRKNTSVFQNRMKIPTYLNIGDRNLLKNRKQNFYESRSHRIFSKKNSKGKINQDENASEDINEEILNNYKLLNKNCKSLAKRFIINSNRNLSHMKSVAKRNLLRWRNSQKRIENLIKNKNDEVS